MKNMKQVALLLFAVLMLSTPLTQAAKSLPIEDYQGVVPTFGSKPITAADVKKAIIKSAVHRGWQPVSDASGKVRLQLDEKKKGAYHVVVDVVYDAKKYVIKYVSSEGLKYDGNSIHSSYSRWVNLLGQTINKELTNASL